jgi:hypothetical protein
MDFNFIFLKSWNRCTFFRSIITDSINHFKSSLSAPDLYPFKLDLYLLTHHVGVVVHLPSFFAEIKATEDKGISTSQRLFISDRAHLVFDFHQLIDGLKEGELRKGGADLGTTRKGTNLA